MRAPAFILSSLLLLLADAASATDNFPAALRDHLQIDSLPGCTLCHTSAIGGANATQPFAVSLLGAGVAASDDASLIAALDELEDNGTDSDADGVGDIDELRAGTNPNVPDEGPDGGTPNGLPPPLPPPQPVQFGFGCAATSTGPAPLGVLAGLLWLMRRPPRRARSF